MAKLTDEQKKILDDEIKRKGLNEFGDKKDTMYAGGTPLFNEMTGEMKDRHEYIKEKHPDWLPQSK